MTIPTNPQEPFSPFLPTTVNYPKEQDRLPSFLEENLANYADVINDKKIGIYMDQAETFNGEKWFYISTTNTRNGYQAIAYIPSFITQTIPLPIENVNPQFIVTDVWGSASKPCSAVGAGDGDYFSFYSQGDARIQFSMSDTSIIINTDAARAAYSGFIIVEYLRNGF